MHVVLQFFLSNNNVIIGGNCLIKRSILLQHIITFYYNHNKMNVVCDFCLNKLNIFEIDLN